MSFRSLLSPHRVCLYLLLSSSSSSSSYLLAGTTRVAFASMSMPPSSQSPPSLPPLSRRLWQAHHPTTHGVLHHPFVKGIGQGTVPVPMFQRYAAQDAHFLQSFAKAYAHAMTKADNPSSIAALSGMIAAVVDELKLHASVLENPTEKEAGDGSNHHKDDVVVPSPACLAYTTFLLDVASSPSSSVAQILAAMCPCMRLYAHVATRLVQASSLAKDKQRPAYLQAWLDTYSSPEFEASAAAVEALLDKEATGNVKEEHEEETKLFALYGQAMQLEYAFFAEQWKDEEEEEWRGLQPTLLVTDFDSTCSLADTTHVLGKAAGHFQGPYYTPQRWKELEDAYLGNLATVLPPLLSPPQPLPPPTDAATYLAPLDTFEVQAVQDVSDSKFLAGIPLASLPTVLREKEGPLYAHLRLQPYCSEVLRAVDARTSPKAFRVLSVSWCPDLITVATGLDPSRVTCNRLEVDASTALSTGKIEVVVDGPGGKLRHFLAFQKEVEQEEKEKEEEGEGKKRRRRRRRRKTSVFIGDSVTDVLALMAADVGVVVGQSTTLRKMVAVLGWEVRPLLALDQGVEGGGKEARVLYEAEDWAEIAACLYGKEGVDWLTRLETK